MLLAQTTLSLLAASTINLWLVAVAVLGSLALLAYLIPIFQKKSIFDLNKVVPMFLACGGIVASVKMMVLAFGIGEVLQNSPVDKVFDAASVLIGAAVFFCASMYALMTNILSSYPEESDVDAHITDSEDQNDGKL